MGFRDLDDSQKIKLRNAWRTVCAKLGISDALEPQNGSGLTMPQLHDERKKVMRALNKITASHADRNPLEEEIQAFEFGAQIMDSLDGWIGSLTKAKNDERGFKDMTVLRSQADFERHYRASSAGESFGLADFIRGVAGMQTLDVVRNALSEGTDAAGGYTVPDYVMPQILGAMVPGSSLMQAGMGVVVLEQGAKSYTTAALENLPTAGWREENGDLAESEPTFRAVPAVPKSLAFIFKVSRELLADSANMESALRMAIGQAFAKELDRTGLRGTGVAPQPRGLLNTAGIQAVGNGANGAVLAGYANLFSGVQKVLEANGPKPTAAIMSPRSQIKLASLVDTTGQPLLVPDMLKDVRQLATSQIPNNLVVGASNDCSEIYMGDFTKMALMLRENVSIQRLNEKYAEKGQVGFACHVRADFAVFYPAAFALVTGVR